MSNTPVRLFRSGNNAVVQVYVADEWHDLFDEEFNGLTATPIEWDGNPPPPLPPPPPIGSVYADFDTWPTWMETENGSVLPTVGVRNGAYYADVFNNPNNQIAFWNNLRGRRDGALFNLPVQVTAEGIGISEYQDETTPRAFQNGSYAQCGIQVASADSTQDAYWQMAVGIRGSVPLTIEGKRTEEPYGSSGGNGSSNVTDAGPNVHTGFVDIRITVNADGTHYAEWKPWGSGPNDWQAYQAVNSSLPAGTLASGSPDFGSSGQARVSIVTVEWEEDGTPFTGVCRSLTVEEL